MKYLVAKPPAQKQFLLNKEEKIRDKKFLDGIHIILKQGIVYDNEKAWDLVKKEIVEKM